MNRDRLATSLAKRTEDPRPSKGGLGGVPGFQSAQARHHWNLASISAKHLAAYLDGMAWRFDNRENPLPFRDTMLKLIHSGNLEYKELTATKAA